MRIPRVLAVLTAFCIATSVHADVSLSVTPLSIPSDYTGEVTVTMKGLSAGETVKFGKFYDANANGVIDEPDQQVMGVGLRDGQAVIVAGVTNINVPVDYDPAVGSFTVRFSHLATGFEQRMPGQYLYRAESLTGSFPALTQAFTITNASFGQKISGNVTSGGSGVPYAWVIQFPGTQVGESYPNWCAVADAAGHYSINVPPGIYSLLAWKSNFVADAMASPTLTITSGNSAQADLALVPATTSISGSLTDTNRSNSMVACVGLIMQSKNGQVALGLTDTSGAFSIPVVAGTWKMGMDEQNNLSMLRYLRPDGENAFDTSAGSVSGVVVNMTRATSLVYGTLKDAGGNPLAGVQVQAGNGFLKGVGISDLGGHYAVGVVGGMWNVEVQAGGAGNLIFSQVSGVSVADDQAVRQDMVGIIANHVITGYLRDGNGNPISGVGIWANTTINGTSFSVNNVTTDSNGFFSLAVADGQWTVGVSAGGGDQNLDPGYLVPNSRTINVSGNNGTVDFVALSAPYRINGHVGDDSQNPIGNVSVYAWSGTAGNQINTGAQTDGNGNFAISVPSGTWHVGVSCQGGQGLQAYGYLCVDEQTVTVSNSNASLSFTATKYVPPVTFQGVTRRSDGSVELMVNGVQGQKYAVEVSTNLSVSNWGQLLLTNAPGGTFMIVDPFATNRERYYRVLPAK